MLTRYLSVGKSYPQLPVVHIPHVSLPQRQHELPPPYQTLRLLNDCPEAPLAYSWLTEQGRQVEWAELNQVIRPSEETQPTTKTPRYRLWEPNLFVQEFIQNLHPKQALDLGCGSGRDAVFLADLGWQVTAVDWLPDALERGRDLQRRYAPESLPIQWVCTDLERDTWQPHQTYDLIVNCFYYSAQLLERAWNWLAPDGLLLLEAFTPTHQKKYGRPASPLRVVPLTELVRSLPNRTTLLHASEDWRENGRHTVRLLARAG